MSKRAFTDEQVAEIQTRLAQGETTNKLAEEFGVSTTTIKNVRRNLYKAKVEWIRTGPKARPVIDRLWEKIDKRGEDECWPWLGACRNNTSIPTLGITGKTVTAYRLLFEKEYGPIPEGESVLHTCRNPQCMNPKHLYTGNKYDWARQLQKGDIDTVVVKENQERAAKRARDYYRDNRDKVKAASSAYQLERKLAAVLYKGGVCQGEECEESHPAALQFHHRNPSEKKFAINAKTLSSPNKISWQEMRKELEKCDLLCANCHSKHHTAWTEEMIEIKIKTLEAYGLANIYEKTI